MGGVFYKKDVSMNVNIIKKYFILLFAAIAIFSACGGNSGGSDSKSGTSGGGDTVVNIANIPDVVTPVRGAVPVTTAIDTAQYTGTIAWSPVDNPFAATTVYTATITLTAKSGYTLTGVTANFFAVAGATTVTNSADSGVVTAVFPATGEVPDIDVVFQSASQSGGTSGSANSTSLILTFDVDPVTLSADNITVTGATKGALSGSGLTRSLAISNITVANGATVSVTITSPTGYSITGSPKTAVVYRLLTIGMDYLGGKIAYILVSGDPGYDVNVPHGLIAATADQDSGSGIIWAIAAYQTTLVTGTGTAIGTGSANTDKIIAQNGAGTTYAAGLARAYTGGGYTDWYLPSKDELVKIYANRTAIGTVFAYANYWSSSEYSANYASFLYFGSGGITDWEKNTMCRVRAVRSF